MKAIEFSGVNLRIAEHQPEYETLPANVQPDHLGIGLQVTMCFELDDEDKKQIAETGQIWLQILQPVGRNFNPLRMSIIKPEL